MVISNIMVINMALKRIDIIPVVLLLWIPTSIWIIVVISMTKNILRVMVRLVSVRSLVEVSKSINSNVTIGELMTRIIWMRKIISQIQLRLLLLQLLDEVAILFHSSVKIYL